MITALAALGLFALGGAVAGGAASEKVKTGQRGKALRVDMLKAKGQLQTRGGSKGAEKRCLNNREVKLSGPSPTFARGVAARLIDTDRTNPKGRWKILPPPDQFFADGTYVIRVTQKTLGGAKKGSKLVKCESNSKKVIRN